MYELLPPLPHLFLTASAVSYHLLQHSTSTDLWYEEGGAGGGDGSALSPHSQLGPLPRHHGQVHADRRTAL